MALKPLQAILPFGQFDGYDTLTTLATGVKGGEVGTLVSVPLGNDKAAADVEYWDGYGNPVPAVRTVVTTVIATSSRPLFLIDDGSKGYGTLFGELVGGVTGKKVYAPGGGTQIGPHTAEGSGKLTLWGLPGLYAITVDVSPGAAGLNTTNSACVTGAALYVTVGTGLLTTTNTSTALAARFVEFSSDRSLVSTPQALVQAFNSPTGSAALTAAQIMTEAVIYWTGGE